MTRDRTLGFKAWKRDVSPLEKIDFDHHVHGTLDGRPAYLSIALGSMCVAQRKESSRNLDWEIERCADSIVAYIQITSNPTRWHDGVRPWIRQGQTDCPHERLQRHLATRSVECGNHCHGVILPDVECRVGKLISKKPETRDVCRPAPARRLEVPKRHRDGVSGFRALHKDRAGHRVDVVERQVS